MKSLSLLSFFVLFLVAYGFSIEHHHDWDPWIGFQVPDENKTALVLLSQKLSGPRYFSWDVKTTQNPFPFITLSSALQQIDPVASQRHLNSSQKEILKKLIYRLVLPSSSRIVIEPKINVLQLNLALDQMP
ncbi:MAG: potassium-transporting ATPase subunit C [Verrucomicrobiota bacterium]